MMLSIVIPNYNGSRTLLDTVKSVVDQIPDSSEVIIIDDCSTDDSIELIWDNFPTIKVIKNNSNLGAAAVRNIGIKYAAGEWILYVDADVLLKPGCINMLLDKSISADIVFPRIFYPNGEVMYPVNKAQTSYLMVSPVFMIRKDSINKMLDPCFDETYRVYCEDTDFFIRAYLAKLVSSYQPSAEAIHNVDLRPRNREFRYFLEMRNSIYGAVKFAGTRDIGKFDHAFRLKNILKVFICGLFNFNLFDMQARGNQKYGTILYNLNLLLKKHEFLTDRGCVVLLGLSIKAIQWNLMNLSLALRAKNRVARQAEMKLGN
jgi:glycosyltransferase involved in cell wall biosynthesis